MLGTIENQVSTSPRVWYAKSDLQCKQLGIRPWLESLGHEYIVSVKYSMQRCNRRLIILWYRLPTTRRDLTPYSRSSSSTYVVTSSFPPYFLTDKSSQAEVIITTPFHPGYLTRDLIEKVSILNLISVCCSVS